MEKYKEEKVKHLYRGRYYRLINDTKAHEYTSLYYKTFSNQRVSLQILGQNTCNEVEIDNIPIAIQKVLLEEGFYSEETLES
ncbi:MULTISPECIES: hypothetical protein [Brevibacillus]|uniref:Uncharacterized protein n=1 Tax=Brevibacillus laterosporus LMG 15441 TaxID=1042163 RepID=A0A075RBF6_BRELA|nr:MULTISPECIES: hypothetical protein [Brevibacillus]AIG26835.1 hypothetical protein BRLA_c025160 [Brevibacillus laterosporus LMG 15441]MCR8964209.1 hypothetical protein [Brevibacillus laterosporus]MCZ0836364.1 hypothetical protein [Brevibacillus halotolerans]PPA84146.1 hypothetical protein C4A76_18080 [Brevibacillus laterosporus]RJL14525.1 hypothetical protein DM460_02535 [Brevibacillus laterosporus]